ncbi:Uncharacterized conserved protein [Janthinobacterium sp. Marseille]|nr:DUF3306 domain-containing protein [Janthinobacterium sp. Marseille]ABR90842.1 Uncharacterized conserved protein [Janthinobacterium sp. Marseille]
MAAEEFFARWAKKNAEAGQSPQVVPEESAGEASRDVVPTAEAPPEAKPLPTMDDVAKLTHDSDYSGFMAQGVDESVKRSAMKKLFTDPHFNIMDGLDVYIEDFSKFEPMTPAFIAGLSHAKGLMDPLAQLKSPLMKLLDMQPEPPALEAPAAASEDTVAPIAATEGEGDKETPPENAAENTDSKTDTSGEPNAASRVADN